MVVAFRLSLCWCKLHIGNGKSRDVVEQLGFDSGCDIICRSQYESVIHRDHDVDVKQVPKPACLGFKNFINSAKMRGSVMNFRNHTGFHAVQLPRHDRTRGLPHYSENGN